MRDRFRFRRHPAAALAAASVGACLFIAGCAREPTPEAASLAWLTGCWEGKAEGGLVDERWSAPAGGTLLGTSRTVKDDKTVFHEFLLVRETEGSLLLTVHAQGQQPVSFRLQQLGKSDAIFANAAHDFPQRIVYHRKGNTLIARAEGEQRDQKRQLRYKLKRTGCD